MPPALCNPREQRVLRVGGGSVFGDASVNELLPLCAVVFAGVISAAVVIWAMWVWGGVRGVCVCCTMLLFKSYPCTPGECAAGNVSGVSVACRGMVPEAYQE